LRELHAEGHLIDLNVEWERFRIIEDKEALFARKNRRKNQIDRFADKQRRYRRWICLEKALLWLCERALDRGEFQTIETAEPRFIRALKAAVFEKQFNLQIDSASVPRILILHEDQDPGRFLQGDIDRARSVSTYNDVNIAKQLIVRLWVRGNQLRDLFLAHGWEVPNWLEPQEMNAEPISPIQSNPPKRAQKRYSISELQAAYDRRRAELGSNKPTRKDDERWATANGYPTKAIRPLREKHQNRTAGQRKSAAK
jgi:hypothetical protein